MSTTERGRYAARLRHAFGDTKKATEPAREGWNAKWECEADPEGVLSPEERAIRADRLMRAHMVWMAACSREARQRKRAEP